MMKQLGIQQVEIPATEVIIKTPDKILIIDNPSVSKVNMMGQESLQITGVIREEVLSSKPDIAEEDIKTVMEQAGVARQTALRAIEDTDGNLAEAIIQLQNSKQ
mgnify:FL=1